jgi:predicted aldo/keto reductase-like oxidoreductase
MRHLEKSLNNLQTDKIDLWQIHNVRGAENEDIEKIFTDDGVLRAMLKAQEEGIVKFLGITGHESPAQLRTLLERIPFDTVLTAINAADKHFNPVIEKLLPKATEMNVGIIGMKIPARDRIFSHGGIITMKQAIEYVLTLPVSTIIVGCDTIDELEENVEITKSFKPLSVDEMLEIENLTKPHYKDLQFFKGLSQWPQDW